MTAAGAAVVTAAAAGVAAAVTSTAVSAVAAATLVVMVTRSESTRAAEIQLEPDEDVHKSGSTCGLLQQYTIN